MKLYQPLTSRLQTQHLALAPIIAHVSYERLILRPAPGKWNIHDNIAHLARYQKLFTGRINQILNEPERDFDRYNADWDEEFPSYQSTALSVLLQTIDEDRLAIFELLTGLSETELARIGNHPKYGRLTILKWAEFFVLHEAHHLFTVFQLANA